ncbi:MAG: ATP-binding protein, partial [Ignavibacteria bacterium]
NILSNAVKYSNLEKEIKINTFSDNNYACIRIEDKGIGIPEEDIREITEPFYRSSNVKTHSATGAGLGLSIVKNIMNAHSGKLEIESQVGRGSKFTLKFPMNN